MISVRQVFQNALMVPRHSLQTHSILAGPTGLGEVGFRDSRGGAEAPPNRQVMVRKLDRAASGQRSARRLRARCLAETRPSISTVTGSSTPPYQTAPGTSSKVRPAAGGARAWRPALSDDTATSAVYP